MFTLQYLHIEVCSGMNDIDETSIPTISTVEVLGVGLFVLGARLTHGGEGSLHSSSIAGSHIFLNRGQEGPGFKEGQVEHPHKPVNGPWSFAFCS